MSTPSTGLSPTQWILLVLNTAVTGLAIANPAEGAVVAAFASIIQTALNAYTANTGTTIDLTKIPIETKVP